MNVTKTKTWKRQANDTMVLTSGVPGGNTTAFVVSSGSSCLSATGTLGTGSGDLSDWLVLGLTADFALSTDNDEKKVAPVDLIVNEVVSQLQSIFDSEDKGEDKVGSTWLSDVATVASSALAATSKTPSLGPMQRFLSAVTAMTDAVRDMKRASTEHPAAVCNATSKRQRVLSVLSQGDEVQEHSVSILPLPSNVIHCSPSTTSFLPRCFSTMQEQSDLLSFLSTSSGSLFLLPT